MTKRPRARGTAASAAALPLALALALGGHPAWAQQPVPDRAVPDFDAYETTAPSDDPELEAQVRTVAAELRCPTCQAESVADSPGEISREMIGVIRSQLEEGKTPDEVKEHFVSAYGEWILLRPEPRGFNLTVYVLPWVGLLVGAGVVVHVVRKWLPGEGTEGEGSVPGPEP